MAKGLSYKDAAYLAKLIKFYKSNPGYVGKHWAEIQGNETSKTAAIKAGFYTRQRGKRTVLRNPYGPAKGKDIWSWAKNPVESPMDKVPPKMVGHLLPLKPRPKPNTDDLDWSKGTPYKSGKTTTTTSTPAPTVNLGGGVASKQLAAIVAAATKLAGQKVAPTITDALIKKYMSQNGNPLASATTDTQLAYGDTLSNLQRQIDSIDKGLPGIESDLDKWYGFVQQANADAKAGDAALLESQTAEAGDAAKAFMAAAGGAAQQGNASVAAQASINDAALRGMGVAQQNFDSNIGQAFAQAAASQKAGIMSQAMRDKSDLRSQLASTQKEMGLYKSKQAQQYAQDNRDLGLQLQQALYEQRKDASDTAWNRILGLANLQSQAALIGPQVQQANLNTAQGIEEWKRSILLNQQERAKLQQFQDTYGGGEQYPFAQLSPGAKANLAAQLQTNLLGPKGYLTVNPNQFLSTIRNRLYNTAGYTASAQTEAFIKSLLEPRLVSWWNKYHPNQTYNG